ncbi:hypothetical protein EZ428_17330 [Pedobacter frigiditerrae]|uniref:Uncharacterized protein n=1 Tax=Pedobacter frigiditerrae TaxID=2530452 RepID=A0A4R0MU84_9SPHI|nr:hypothetical protein [Pedobacter frigiditerrae]TCC89454.1 hypothetical protein EZ428_17330 [Pedobacter frigiditerrae]
MKAEKENRSPHILNTSANLLGFCFIVLTSVKISKLEESSFIDEGAALAIIIFMSSCLLSFLAMRSTTVRATKMERGADILFLIGLIVLFITTMLIAFNIIK